MRYEGTIYRPPNQANSYLLQCTIGCSHNRCTFCGMYKDKKYRIRSLEEIKYDIQLAKNYYGDLKSVFLCDGDAIAIETSLLIEILDTLYTAFPSLQSVGTYVGPRSTLNKSLGELLALRAAGLTTAYLGVESGHNEVLKEIRKGVTSEEMLEAGQRLVQSDYDLAIMVMLGIAGHALQSREHILATAHMCNDMKPHALAALTFTPVQGTELYRRVQDERFKVLSPGETLNELKILLENLAVDNLLFMGQHVSNYLPMSGILPQDRPIMLNRIKNAQEYISKFNQP